MAIAVFGTTIVACASRAPDASQAANEATSEGLTWRRVSLGFVSAYLLVRSGEVALVDTGVAGSTGDIEAGLDAVGLGWKDVGHVLLTHLHPDHIGSLPEVLTLVPEAAAYAGTGDIPTIEASLRGAGAVASVGDGDTVFGLEVIDTPGHTPGHICVLDRAAGVLVAGDALNGEAGGVVGPNPAFSEDMDLANESVKKLAGLSFETVLFGHGDPVVGGAALLVADLAAEA